MVQKLDVKIQKDTQQQLTFSDAIYSSINFQLNNVYAKYRSAPREELWIELVDISNCTKMLWAILMSSQILMKKEGGRPHKAEKTLDFISCIFNYGIEEASFVGNIFT